MAGLANLYFGDLFATLDPGIRPQTLATGTTSGSAVQLSPASGGFQKYLARVLAGSGSTSASLSMYIATATASNGTFTSLSQTLVSAALSLSSQYELKIDTRDEAFCNLGSSGSAAAAWIKVVLALGGAPVPLSLDLLGWESADDPSSLFNATTVVQTVTVFY